MPANYIYVFRPAAVDSAQLLQAVEELKNRTVYKRTSFREHAPKVTDCLTSLHYIFKKAGLDIPVQNIGDIPRKLVASSWCPLKVKSEEVKCGDLVFCRNKDHIKLFSHVALIVNVNQIFHCTAMFGTAVVQTEKEFFANYAQTLSFKSMVRYVDPRSDLRRKKIINGIFLE